MTIPASPAHSVTSSPRKVSRRLELQAYSNLVRTEKFEKRVVVAFDLGLDRTSRPPGESRYTFSPRTFQGSITLTAGSGAENLGDRYENRSFPWTKVPRIPAANESGARFAAIARTWRRDL